MPAAPLPQATLTNKTTALQAAAHKYNVPVAILEGVWGAESNFGQNTNVSSAGAIGNFQFLPSTAGAYNYPLVSNPNPAQFAQQADAAAHYLSDLFKAHGGNWTAALNAYNGNKSGTSPSPYTHAVQHFGSTGPLGGNNGFLGLGITVPNPLAPVESVASGVSSIANFVTNTTNWLRIGEVIAGIVLVLLGLKSLTGVSVAGIVGAPAAATKAAVVG